MKIRAGTIESDINVITTNLQRLVVKRLCDIANEMHDELQSICDFSIGQARALDPRSVVRNSRDRASLGTTIATVVHTAG